MNTQHIKAPGVPLVRTENLGKSDGSTVQVAVEPLSSKPFRRVVCGKTVYLSSHYQRSAGFRWFLWHGVELVYTGRADTVEQAVLAGTLEARARGMVGQAVAA